MASYIASNWNEQELAYLREHYEDGPLTSQQIADHLGRSLCATKAKASKIGLKYKSKARYGDGTKQCTRCKALLPYEEFYTNNKNKDGYDCACKTCEALRGAKKREVAKKNKLLPATKVCCRCKIEKPNTEFYKSSINATGLGSWCKACEYIRKQK